jgi:hypothetical protein
MNRILAHIAFTIMGASVGVAQLIPDLGGQRAGISSLQFLKIGVGGRGAALGESMVAVANDVSAIFWNPAGLPHSRSNAVMMYHGEWLVELKHDFIGMVYHLGNSDVVGVSVISLATEDMKVTTETQPLGTGAYFKYSDVAVGLTYSRRMTEQFSFGATARYIQENLDILKVRAILFDLGTYYVMGLGSARFGVVVTNFGSDVTPTGDVRLLDGSTVASFQPFSPPTVFKLGFAFEPLMDETQRVTLSVQLNHPNDNAENVRIGFEYEWQSWLSLRAGLKRTVGEPFFGIDKKSADDYSLGIGVKMDLGFTTTAFDYAFTNFNELGSVHRVSLEFTY